MIITSFFTYASTPALGLTPTIRIWLVDPAGNELVVGSPDGTHSTSNLSMTEVGDGFYSFDFTVSLGYNPDKSYLVKADGGIVLDISERYQVTNISPIDGVTNFSVADQVWDEASIDHTLVGSTGQILNSMYADVVQLRLDVITILDLVEMILKYESNRTKIDKVAKTLTVYDDDGVTPIRVFQLKDSNGIPSITEITERVPN